MTVRMGRKLAEAAARIIGDSLLDKRYRARPAIGVPVTYPVALGALFAALGLSEEDAFARAPVRRGDRWCSARRSG